MSDDALACIYICACVRYVCVCVCVFFYLVQAAFSLTIDLSCSIRTHDVCLEAGHQASVIFQTTHAYRRRVRYRNTGVIDFVRGVGVGSSGNWESIVRITLISITCISCTNG